MKTSKELATSPIVANKTFKETFPQTVAEALITSDRENQDKNTTLFQKNELTNNMSKRIELTTSIEQDDGKKEEKTSLIANALPKATKESNEKAGTHIKSLESIINSLIVKTAKDKIKSATHTSVSNPVLHTNGTIHSKTDKAGQDINSGNVKINISSIFTKSSIVSMHLIDHDNLTYNSNISTDRMESNRQQYEMTRKSSTTKPQDTYSKTIVSTLTVVLTTQKTNEDGSDTATNYVNVTSERNDVINSTDITALKDANTLMPVVLNGTSALKQSAPGSNITTNVSEVSQSGAVNGEHNLTTNDTAHNELYNNYSMHLNKSSMSILNEMQLHKNAELLNTTESTQQENVENMSAIPQIVDNQTAQGQLSEENAGSLEIDRNSSRSNTSNTGQGSANPLQSSTVTNATQSEIITSSEHNSSLYNSSDTNSNNFVLNTNETNIKRGGQNSSSTTMVASDSTRAYSTTTNSPGNRLAESTISDSYIQPPNKEASQKEMPSDNKSEQKYDINVSDRQASFKELGIIKETLKDDIVEIVNSVNLVDGESILNTKLGESILNTKLKAGESHPNQHL